MRHLAPVSRVLLGLVFLVFGANFFVTFLPAQPPPPAEAMAFAGVLYTSKLLTLIKIIELVAAVALLSNRFVPLALALLAPIIVGIVFFHVMLAPAGMVIAFGVLALELLAAWSYRGAFLPMLRVRVAPDPVAHRVPALAVS